MGLTPLASKAESVFVKLLVLADLGEHFAVGE